MEIKELKRKRKCRRLNRESSLKEVSECSEIKKSSFCMELLNKKLCKLRGKGRIKCKKPSKERVIQEILGDVDTQKRLFSMGLLPDTKVHLLECRRAGNHPMAICLNGHHIMLDSESSKYIIFKDEE